MKIKKEKIGKENIKKLGFYFIPPKDIILKPNLFKKDNNVEVKIIDGQITPENIHLAKGFDGVQQVKTQKFRLKFMEN